MTQDPPARRHDCCGHRSAPSPSARPRSAVFTGFAHTTAEGPDRHRDGSGPARNVAIRLRCSPTTARTSRSRWTTRSDGQRHVEGTRHLTQVRPRHRAGARNDLACRASMPTVHVQQRHRCTANARYDVSADRTLDSSRRQVVVNDAIRCLAYTGRLVAPTRGATRQRLQSPRRFNTGPPDWTRSSPRSRQDLPTALIHRINQQPVPLRRGGLLPSQSKGRALGTAPTSGPNTRIVGRMPSPLTLIRLPGQEAKKP